ncbi:hypothetical protein H6S82_08890 [Planktothrix sp. FACHB-1355]|uniref:Uncharacterized protein n=1 Tax=Aerosakkonema funiforme FACHB-1375 TaxID=2949571 RepID=A0A926ZFE5_9CYAN|nr:MULTISPECIES: hypothetical protein [Oscillatoriales]MBD2181028.1 hypothetical protein [Aerosakkonema funiforme FACHB-1375]MBD3558973.1 hypothetical protein [Planktothrix sp. FACHB-1355]
MADILTSTCELIDAREYARQLLDQLPSITDASTDLVDYHGITIPFSTARLLGFQSYLSTTWAVCDSIISGISLLLFNKTVGKDQKSPPNLLTVCVKGNAAHYNSFFVLKNYGWPIAVSYVIRNHFVHDGASHFGYDFFAGRGKADEYQISLASQGGWSFLEDQMNQKHRDVKKDYTRLTETWPWHQDNLLKLLELCNDEIDEAVTCLVGWSVGMATLQARYLLERDFSPILSPPTSP